MYELIERKPMEFDGLGDIMDYTNTTILIGSMLVVLLGASMLLGFMLGGSMAEKIMRTIASFIMFSVVVSGMAFMMIHEKVDEIRDVQKNGVDMVVYERKGIKVAGIEEPLNNCHAIKVATPKTREDGSYEYLECVDAEGIKKGDIITAKIEGQVSGDTSLPSRAELNVVDGVLDRYDTLVEKEGADSNEK